MKTFFYIAAVEVALNLFQVQLVATVAEQTCGTSDFYCPYLRGGGGSQTMCLPRNQRCLGGSTPACTDPTTGEEPKCRPASAMGAFVVWVFRASLLSSDSFRRRRATDLELEHQGVNYRGFDYEFGAAYPNGQELDTLDPKYKYRDGRDDYSLKTFKGFSRCGRTQAYNYMTKWASEHEYGFFGRIPFTNYANCQTFTHKFVDFLLYECGQAKRSAPTPSCNCTCKDYYVPSSTNRLSPMAIPTAFITVALVLKIILV